MNLLKRFSTWVKELFTGKPKELPPPQEEMPKVASLKEALEAFIKLAEQLPVEIEPTPTPSFDYNSGDRSDNKPKALQLAAGQWIGSLRRDIDPSAKIRDEFALAKEMRNDRRSWKSSINISADEFDKMINEATQTKLERATRAAARMVERDLLASDEVSIAKQIDEIMAWGDEAIEAMERILVRKDTSLHARKNALLALAKSGKKKPARKPKKNKAKEVRLSPKKKINRSQGKRK